mgnify:FL=1
MKYNTDQLNRINKQVLRLGGESQKSVWSLIKSNGQIRLGDIAKRLGKDRSAISSAINALIGYNLVERYTDESGNVVRGVYAVSNYIMRGE